ncbi:MAG: hypothetical protein KGL20_05015 [Rhodospirillales bacterium]|nr:hypothetical protein [Rhodospirillales bacterium]
MRSALAIAGVIVIAAVVFFVVPMAAGGSANVCQALEKHDVSNAAANIAGANSGPVHDIINSVGQSMATGNIAAQSEAQAHPDMPVAVSCAASYWKSL